MAQAGFKDASLFEKVVKRVWNWAQPSQWIRWFTEGERHYSIELWKLASVYLSEKETAQSYGYRKVWREGLEVAIKVKGSQDKPHVEWVRPEHPFTAISRPSEVHANHNEAHNSSLRRRASAYHRRMNHYAKVVEGLQRALDVQRLLHNWVRPHWELEKKQTPAMAIGYLERPVTMLELLSSRGIKDITS